jgi:hypothetical protein
MNDEKSNAPGDSVTAATDSVAVRVTETGIRRLNAEDGLFLRADHLRQIQDYAREIALLAGAAAGPGVDYGFNVTLEGSAIHVTPGLAIDAARRPLRTLRDVTVSLEGLDTTDINGFWIVEVAAGPPEPSGSEPVYGTLCDDPCGGGSIPPWLDASVIVRVVPDTLPGLDEVQPVLKRNRLASLYFERERRNHNPWLTPRTANAPVSSILDRPWERGRPEAAPQPGSVPIAALLRVGGEWVLDTWIARRDIGGPPARAAWEGHLGLRPWNIFLAHVLQFQAQLADGDEQLWRVGPRAPNRESAILARISEAVHALPTPGSKIGKQNHQAAVTAVSELEHAYTAKSVDGTATQFGELPPAGILPLPGYATPDDIAAYFRSRFGDQVAVEVEATRADCALRALENAQHLDRIPLNAAEPYPFVRLFVPSEPADLPPLVPQDGYSWVVFTRGCGRPRNDDVDAYVLPGRHLNSDQALQALADAVEDPPDPVTTLSYPHDTCAVPGPAGAMGLIRDAVASVGTDPDTTSFVVVGVAASPDRQSLAFARAGLLAVDLRPQQVPPAAPRPFDQIVVVTSDDLGREAIVFAALAPPQ